MNSSRRAPCECAQAPEKKRECYAFIFEWAELINDKCQVGDKFEEIKVLASGKAPEGKTGIEVDYDVLVKGYDVFTFKQVHHADRNTRKGVIKIKGVINTRDIKKLVGHLHVKCIGSSQSKQGDKIIYIKFNHRRLFSPIKYKGMDHVGYCSHGPVELTVHV